MGDYNSRIYERPTRLSEGLCILMSWSWSYLFIFELHHLLRHPIKGCPCHHQHNTLRMTASKLANDSCPSLFSCHVVLFLMLATLATRRMSVETSITLLLAYYCRIGVFVDVQNHNHAFNNEKSSYGIECAPWRRIIERSVRRCTKFGKSEKLKP